MRLINADALKEAITNNPLIDFTDDDIFELIDNAPTVEERPQGEWVKNEHTFWTCSHCNWFNDMNRIKYNFCPCCGADMQKGGAE